MRFRVLAVALFLVCVLAAPALAMFEDDEAGVRPEGMGCAFAEGTDIEDTFMPLRDVIVQYVRKHSPLDVRVEGRITSVDR